MIKNAGIRTEYDISEKPGIDSKGDEMVVKGRLSKRGGDVRIERYFSVLKQSKKLRLDNDGSKCKTMRLFPR